MLLLLLTRSFELQEKEEFNFLQFEEENPKTINFKTWFSCLWTLQEPVNEQGYDGPLRMVAVMDTNQQYPS